MRWSRLHSLVVPGWLSLLLGVLSCLFAGALVAHIVADRPPVGVDPAFYQHVGWYVTQGAVPYVDIWDINPPLTFGLAALLAFVADGNLAVQHVLGVLATFAAGGGAVLLTSLLAHDLTGSDSAALAAGFVLLTSPAVYAAPWGLRSQVFALFFGVLALILVRRDRPFLAGGSAVAAAGFWQPGGAVVFLVVGMAAERRGWIGGLRAVTGSAVIALTVAVPFLLADAFVPMVAQTVVAPFVGQEPFTLVARAFAALLAMGYATTLLPVAILGWIRAPAASSERWWIPAGGLLYALQLAVVNMNGTIDTMVFLVFVGLGVAAVVKHLPTDRRRWAVAVLGLLVLAAPAWHLAPGAPLRDTAETGYERAVPDSQPVLVQAERYPPEVRTIYWQKRRPASCHYRLSHTELRWIAETDATLDEDTCGLWPW